MKRYISVLIVILVMASFMLAGCSFDVDDSSTTDGSSSSSSSSSSSGSSSSVTTVVLTISDVKQTLTGLGFVTSVDYDDGTTMLVGYRGSDDCTVAMIEYSNSSGASSFASYLCKYAYDKYSSVAVVDKFIFAGDKTVIAQIVDGADATWYTVPSVQNFSIVSGAATLQDAGYITSLKYYTGTDYTAIAVALHSTASVTANITRFTDVSTAHDYADNIELTNTTYECIVVVDNFLICGNSSGVGLLMSGYTGVWYRT